MMKKSTLWVLLYSIFLVVFNVVFFMLGGAHHSTTVWLSYGFIHLAYLTVAATSLTVLKSSTVPTLGLTLSTVSLVYFLSEFAVGLLFILIGANIIKVALTIQIILFGIYAVLLVANMISNAHTDESVKNSKKGVFFVKECSSRVKMLIGKTSDNKIDAKLEGLYDYLHSSPARAVPSLQKIESDIIEKLSYLECAVDSNDLENAEILISKILSMTEERNRNIKISD